MQVVLMTFGQDSDCPAAGDDWSAGRGAWVAIMIGGGVVTIRGAMLVGFKRSHACWDHVHLEIRWLLTILDVPKSGKFPRPGKTPKSYDATGLLGTCQELERAIAMSKSFFLCPAKLSFAQCSPATPA